MTPTAAPRSRTHASLPPGSAQLIPSAGLTVNLPGPYLPPASPADDPGMIASSYALGRRPPSPPAAKRRLLIVDDNWFFAACLRTVIDQEADLVVCDTARSSARLPEAIRHYAPDLLLIDLTLGNDSGLQLADTLRRSGVATPILLISSLVTPARRELERIGRCAFWPKGEAHGFLRRVRRLLDGSAPGPVAAPLAAGPR